MGWNLDDSRMYLADSYANLVYHAPFRSDDGDIGRLDILVEVDGPGVPDGMSIDVEGCLWVAIWGGSELRRYDAAGRLVGVVPVPVTQPSSCAFDSTGRLYITSARKGLSPEQLARQPLAGSVFTVETDTLGVPVHSFAG
jgi:sugar lactone lactonase YvrE